MPEIGQTIAHYKILEKIGVGGMGEVYLAEDLSLDRKVALKFLPDVFTGDPERMARFEREAKLLASLNHPNIAAIYGLEQADGKRFLIMEYVEGETLQARISKGALPLDEALGVCKQIAEGLEAAHEKGVIHRDLKPANVMITGEEKVKILDFGLAKALADEIQSIDSSQSPTITEAMTQPGVVLGTAAYMSPEQAKGKSVDRRADIWAFGCILYECLTGKKVFEGETVTETLAAILRGEPDWQSLPTAIAPNIRFVMRRCLEKDIDRRFRDAADVQIQIEETQEFAETNTHKSIQRQPLVWILAFIAAAALVYALLNTRSSVPGTVDRLAIPLPPGEELTDCPAISPDGRTIAYISKKGVNEPQLYLRDLNSFEARAVIGSSGAEQPFFSPDGRWIAFFAKGQLLKSQVTGGSPIRLYDAPTHMGGTWNEDNTIIFTTGLSSGLLQIPADGGESESLTKPDGESQGYAHVWPQSLPGGNSVLFTIWGSDLGGGDAMLSLESRRWQLVGTQTGSIYAPSTGSTGHLLCPDNNSGIRAAAFNPARPTLTNPDTSVLSDVYFTDHNLKIWLAISKTGTAVYAHGNPTKKSLVWVDHDGEIEQFVKEQAPYSGLTLSPEGSQALVTLIPDIWIYDLQRPGTRSLLIRGGFTSGWNLYPTWSRDGKSVFFCSNRGGDWDLYSQPVEGSLPPKALLKRPYEQDPISEAPDGTLLFREWHPTTGIDIWALSPDGKVAPILVTPFNDRNADLSPDGSWIAFDSDESGRYEVYIQDYPEGKKRVPVSSEGGEQPIWSNDGNKFFYFAGDAMMEVIVRANGTIVSVPQKIFDSRDFISDSYDISQNDNRFLMIRRDQDSVPTQLNVILNWFEELRRLVPTGR